MDLKTWVSIGKRLTKLVASKLVELESTKAMGFGKGMSVY